MKQLSGRRVFITGGTTGIGFELAKLYRSNGHIVGVCGRDLTKLQDPNFDSYQVDVSDEQSIKNAISNFCNKNGSLDIVIANAGIGMSRKDGTLNFELAKNVLNINVMGVLYTFEAAIENFSKAGGQLVAISSVAAFAGLPGIGPYSASKAAVLRLCESYGIDLAKKGIFVTAICPGFIDTPLTQKNDHKMPFIMDAQKAATKIYLAVDKKIPLYVFPWQMNVVMRFAEKAPRWLYRKMVMKGMKMVMPGRSK